MIKTITYVREKPQDSKECRTRQEQNQTYCTVYRLLESTEVDKRKKHVK